MKLSMLPKHFPAFLLVSCILAAPAVAETVANCTIAAKDGSRTYRTDTVQRCSVNLVTGETKYIIEGQEKQRQYQAKLPLAQKHFRAVKRWQKRRLRIVSGTKPNLVRFDLDVFLQEAARAKSGYVLVRRTKKGKKKLNIVFITNGIYRYVDLDGQGLFTLPSGLMVAGG